MQLKKRINDLHKFAFIQNGFTVATKHVKICSTSPTFNETYIKTTMRYHFIPVRMAIVKKIDKDLEVISTLTVYDPKFKITQNTELQKMLQILYIFYL